MRKLFTILVLTVMTLFGGTVRASAAQQQYSIATNPVGMALFTLGATLSEVMKKSYPGIQLNVEATNGGIHNTLLLEKREVELGFTSALEAVASRAGTGRYKKKTPILGMFAPVIGPGQCPALASSGIKTVQDLRGKRVGVVRPGAMVRPITDAFLEAYGMTTKDMTIYAETLGNLVDKMKNGQLDAILWFGVVPLGPMMDLAKSRELVWLGVEPKALEPVLKKYPHLFASEIPAGSYTGQDKTVPTVAERYLVVALEDVPDDVVYAMVKSVYENLPELGQAYRGWSSCTLETALDSMTIPLHPGAVRYYREVKLPGLEAFLAKYPGK